MRMDTRYWAASLLALLAACRSADPLPLGFDGHPIGHYQVAGAQPPDGVEASFQRGGYLHPLLTPSGRCVTGDFPPSHHHQHGVSFPWTRTRVGGRAIDFWNTGAGEGTLRARLIERGATHLVAEHDFVDLTGELGDRVVLRDRWELSWERRPEAVVVDLTSTQRAQSLPVEFLEYHYGGMTVRGSLAWEAPADRCAALTSHGHDRAGADGARVRWCALTGDLEDGAPATVAILGHPSNPRAPQPVRVHPEVPYFCFAPSRLGPWTLAPGQAQVSRYRIVACDGPPNPALLDRLWGEFARSDRP